MWITACTPPTPLMFLSDIPEYRLLSEEQNPVPKKPQQILAFCIFGSLSNPRGVPPPRCGGMTGGLSTVLSANYVRDECRHKGRTPSKGAAVTAVWHQHQSLWFNNHPNIKFHVWRFFYKQSVSQSASQSVNQSVNKSVSQSASQSVSQ